MLFHKPQKKKTLPNLPINDTVIEFVDNFVFLGKTLNKHLTWNNHVTGITNKIARTVGMRNNLKKILPLNILHVIYNCLVLPHLNYGIPAWGRQTKELDIIHKKVIRTLKGGYILCYTFPSLRLSADIRVPLSVVYNRALTAKQSPLSRIRIVITGALYRYLLR